MIGSEPRSKLIGLLQRSWRTEMEGAATYRWLAGQTEDPPRKKLLEQLAQAEERHARRWAERLQGLGAAVPPAPPPGVPTSVRLRATVDLDSALAQIEAEEERHLQTYEAHAAALGDPEIARLMREVAHEEAQHARILQGMIGPVGAQEPRGRLEAILKGERHVSTGSWLGDAIYGANDGLGAVFGLVSGVAGAAAPGHFILLAGIAGAVASSVSMGSGAFLAARSEREVYDAEVSRERAEIAEDPGEEKEELALFYELKGFSKEEADTMAERLAKQPDQFLNALVREELGLSADRLPAPVVSALSATLSTAIGACLPVLPFLFLAGTPAILAAFGASLLGHFAIGAAKSLFTIRPWWSSGLEMTAIGVVVGAVTYAAGYLFGIA